MAQNDSNANFYTGMTVLTLLGAAALLWYLFADVITSSVRWLRIGEMKLLSIFTSKYDGLLKVLPEMKVAPHAVKISPMHLDWPTVWNISTSIGDIMRYPVTVVLLGCLGWIMYKSPKVKFKNKYNLEGLMKVQSQNWPVISPVVNFDPAKGSARVPGSPVPSELPVFAESLTADEWIVWSRIPIKEGSPDKEGVRQALTQQLGPRWQGMAGLKPHHKALVAAFALKGAQKRSESDKLLGQIAQGWSPATGLVISEETQKAIDAVLADKKLLGPALQIASQHAYRTPALLGMLRWAREQGGVLAPAQFVWLRGQDRALWYPLNNLGRRSYHAEAAGAMAHFMAESVAKKPLPMPRVETAIQPIIDYVTPIISDGRMPELEIVKPKPPADTKKRAGK